MIRSVVAVGASAALGVWGAWAILTDSYPHEGPYVSFSASHGIHLGDLVIVAGWLVVTLLLAAWVRRHRTRPPR